MTKRTAERIARRLTEHFGYGKYAVYEPGFHSSGWTIASEDGPPDWPMHAYPLINRTEPKVFAEPVNHWCLGLYDNN